MVQHQPSLDSPLLFYYTRHFYNLGYMLEEKEMYKEAIIQYERTLEIDPSFAQAYKSMGVIYGYKMEPKDKFKAVENFNRYYNFVSSVEEAQAVQQAIWELSQPEEATISAGADEATESGKIGEATESGELVVEDERS